MRLKRLTSLILAATLACAAVPVPALAAVEGALPRALHTAADVCAVSSPVPALNNTRYATLEDAFDAIRYDTSQKDGYGNVIKNERPESTSATVTLVSGSKIKLSNHIEVVHDVTLDLNGGTITVDFLGTTDPSYSTDHSFAMGFLVSGGATNHGNLTVVDKSTSGSIVVKGAGEAIRCQGGGAVTIRSGAIEIPSDGEGRYCVECLGGHLTIEGGTFTNSRTDIPTESQGYGLGCVTNGVQAGAGAGTTTITGGTFISTNRTYYTIVSQAGKLEISSPSVASQLVVDGNGGAVSVQGGTATISGGSFTGVSSVLYAGDNSYYGTEFDQRDFERLTVSGGTFTNSGIGSVILVGPKVAATPGDLIQVTGGEFTGFMRFSGPITTSCTLSLEGGTYNNYDTIEERVAQGFLIEDLEDGRYRVVRDPNEPEAPEERDNTTILSSMVGIDGVTVVAYTGSTIEPKVTVVSGTETLRQDVDYTVSYDNNLNVGTATVLVEGKGAWHGEVRKYFTITERSIVGSTLTFEHDPCPYVAGVDPDPGVGVLLSDGTVLVRDRDFVVSYEVNEVVGSGTATVRAKGNYSGSLAGNFTLRRGYRVEFIDGVDNRTILERVVEQGGTAVPPDVPEHAGYEFDHWEGTYTGVTADTTITARYVEATGHLVRFIDGIDGSEIKRERVEDGQPATAPPAPTHEGYSFVSWSAPFDTVTSDLVITATYASGNGGNGGNGGGGTGTGDGSGNGGGNGSSTDPSRLPSTMLDNATGRVRKNADGTSTITITDYDGSVASGWRMVGGAWYYAGDKGVAVSGRVDIAGRTYYFDANCKLRTGWVWDPTVGGWVWAESSDGPYLGVVAKNGWVWDGAGWYLAGPNGVVRTGWAWVDSTCYHLNTGEDGGVTGRMDTGWVHDGTAWFWCDNSGAMQADRWVYVGGSWYLLGGSGMLLTGWQWRDGVWYLLQDSGAMSVGWTWHDGAWYYFWSDGRMLHDTITPDGYWVNSDGTIIW